MATATRSRQPLKRHCVFSTENPLYRTFQMGAFAFQIDGHGIGLQGQRAPPDGDRHRNADPALGLIVVKLLRGQFILGIPDDHVTGHLDIVGSGIETTLIAGHRDLAAVFGVEDDPDFFEGDRLCAVTVIGGGRFQTSCLAAVLDRRVPDVVDGDIGPLGKRFHKSGRTFG